MNNKIDLWTVIACMPFWKYIYELYCVTYVELSLIYTDQKVSCSHDDVIDRTRKKKYDILVFIPIVLPFSFTYLWMEYIFSSVSLSIQFPMSDKKSISSFFIDIFLFYYKY